MSDEYRTVTFRLIRVRPNSLIIEVPKRQGEKVLPRSLIHGMDDLHLNGGQSVPREITIRIFSWKADSLGLS